MQKDLSINDMLSLSNELHEQHKHKWGKKTPESNTAWLLWLVGEIGEVIDIIKKKGPKKIMHEQKTRAHTLEEITDCYMYLADILNRYEFTAEEFSKTYHKKINKNLKRKSYRNLK
jgi:NTP pyrophosphatase (non-canonical NTP hydrolase)